MKDYAFPEEFVARLHRKEWSAVTVSLPTARELACRASKEGDKLVWRKCLVPQERLWDCPPYLEVNDGEEVPTKTEAVRLVLQKDFS